MHLLSFASLFYVLPSQVCLAKPFPGRVATCGKGRVSRNNKLDCSVLTARCDDISHLGKVFVKVSQFVRHLLVAARLEGAALPLDHLGLLIVRIVFTKICHLIPWQEVAHNIRHAPFLHLSFNQIQSAMVACTGSNLFDDSAVATMMHHLRGFCQIKEQTWPGSVWTNYTKPAWIRLPIVGSPSHRRSWGQAEWQRKWSTSLPWTTFWFAAKLCGNRLFLSKCWAILIWNKVISQHEIQQ